MPSGPLSTTSARRTVSVASSGSKRRQRTIARDKPHRPSIAAGLLGDRRRRRNRDFGIRLVGAEDIGRNQAEALSDGGPARAELQRLAKRKVHAAIAGYRMIAVFQRIDAVI